MKPIEFVTFLFEIKTQIHHLHHITNSYAEHKALGKFYENWDELADTFIETYQGKYGNIVGSGLIKFDNENAVIVINNAKKILDKAPILEGDKDLQNIVADLLQLCNHTLYLLTLK